MFSAIIIASASALAIFILAAVAVIVTAPSEEQLRARQQAEADNLRRQIEQAKQRHAPRKHLYRQLVEARRKELERA